MNVVHRCRFTDWAPSAIISLSIAPSGVQFAALRANGNIEIWTQIVQENPDSVLSVVDNGVKYELSTFLSRFQPKEPLPIQQNDINTMSDDTTTTPTTTTTTIQNHSSSLPTSLATSQEHLFRYASIYYLSSQWACTTLIPGTGKNVFSQLLWSYVDPIANPTIVPHFTPHITTSITSSTSPLTQSTTPKIIDRLFSLGSNGTIVEWDQLTSMPKYSTSAHGGSIKCGSVSPSGTQLAVGCRDGRVRIFSIANAESEPILTKTLSKHKGPVLSIDWLHFAHIAPPPQPIIQQDQSNRPGIVQSAVHRRVTNSSWWDTPLIASGGQDGALRIWNITTGICTLELKNDKIRFNVHRESSKEIKKLKLDKIRAHGNKAFTKEAGVKNIAIKGAKVRGNLNAIQTKQNLQKLQANLRKSIRKDKSTFIKQGSTVRKMQTKQLKGLKLNDPNLMTKLQKIEASKSMTKQSKKGSKLKQLQNQEDGLISSSDDDEDDEDDDNTMNDNSEEEEDDDESLNDGLSDDEISDDQQEEENDEDVGFLPVSKGKKTKGNKNAREIKLEKIKKGNLRAISIHGGRVKAKNSILKVKWLDVESVACLDLTAQLLIINARTGIITSKTALQQILGSPTDLAIIPATLHTRSLAHPHNITYETRFSYQVHPSNIIPGKDQQLLNTLLSTPLIPSNQIDLHTQPQQITNYNNSISSSILANINKPRYISAFRSNQVYTPHPVIYVSGSNGRVIELSGTNSIGFNSSTTAATSAKNMPTNTGFSLFAHGSKFISTGIHGAHTHDILCLTIAPTVIRTYNNNMIHNNNNNFTSQLTLLTSGVDTVITTYGIHPFNINDVNIVKTYFQILKPIRQKLLSGTQPISLSNYTSPWSHHWTIGKHQEDYNQTQLQNLQQNFTTTHYDQQQFLNKQKLLEKNLIETSYHIHTAPGVRTLPKMTICLCPQCKLSNVPSILNNNIIMRLLYSLHSLPNTKQTQYQFKVNNIGKGSIHTITNTSTSQATRFYEPYVNCTGSKSTILSYIPLNSIDLSFTQQSTSNLKPINNIKSTCENTMVTDGNRLQSLLEVSPTIDYVQQPAPSAPLLVYPRDFSIDIYTLTNQDQLLVRDKQLFDDNTQLKCSPVELNNVLCDMQLYQGTVVLDRNAVIATLLSMYSLRSQQQERFLHDQTNTNNNTNQQGRTNNTTTVRNNSSDTQLRALETELAYHQANPHLFRDGLKLGRWNFHEPAFGLLQHPTSTFQSTSQTVETLAEEDKTKEDNNNQSKAVATPSTTTTPSTTSASTTTSTAMVESEAVRTLPNGRVIKLPTNEQLPFYLLSLHLALSNVSASTTTLLSPNGRLLLVSDATEIKLWGLKWSSISPNCHPTDERNSKKQDKKNHKLQKIQDSKHAIFPNKIDFPPKPPRIEQYARSALQFIGDSRSGAEYAKCVEEHGKIVRLTQLLKTNGCSTAAFSPCSSMLAVSLAPYAGSDISVTTTEMLNQFDSDDLNPLLQEDVVVSTQYPYLGTIVLIDLITYQIIGYIQRNKIEFFSKAAGVHLPSTKSTTTTLSSSSDSNVLVDAMKNHYKTEYELYQRTLTQEQTIKNMNDIQQSSQTVIESTPTTVTQGKTSQQSKPTEQKPPLTPEQTQTLQRATKMRDELNHFRLYGSTAHLPSDDTKQSSNMNDDNNNNKDHKVVDDDEFKLNLHSTSSNSLLSTTSTELPTRRDLVTGIQFSPCGRYLSTLDQGNKIRLYQLLDRFFTPTCVHVQTILSKEDNSNNNDTQSTSTQSSTTTQRISSYQLLPTVADIRTSHLCTSQNGIEENQLTQRLNSKQLLSSIIGPNRIERVIKTLFKWALVAAEQYSKNKPRGDDSDSEDEFQQLKNAVPKPTTTSTSGGKSALFKKSATSTTSTTSKLATSTTTTSTTSTNSKSINNNKQQQSNTNQQRDGYIVKNDEDFDSDSDDNNEHSASSVIESLNPATLVQLGISSPTLGTTSPNSIYGHDDKSSTMNDTDGDSFRISKDGVYNPKGNKGSAKQFFESIRRNVRVDTNGFNPHHLLSELLHLLIISQFSTPISKLFLSLNKMTSGSTTNNQPATLFHKLMKEKITNVTQLSSSTAQSSYLFNNVDFDHDVHPSVCGSYQNGHYFVYDTTAQSHLVYDTTRPQDIGLSKTTRIDSTPKPKSSVLSTKQLQQLQQEHEEELATSSTRALLLQQSTHTITTSINNTTTNTILSDPLIPPRKTNYYSQVMPFKELTTFNENNPNIPSLLHADIAPIFSTSQHVNYRPLVSVDSVGDKVNPYVLGGLLSSVNIIFATNDDSYTLSLPLHRIYPSVFKHIITSGYNQVMNLIMLLEKLNPNLIQSNVNKDNNNTTTTNTKDKQSINATTIAPKQATKRKAQTQMDTTTDSTSPSSDTLLKIGQLHNINHHQRIELLLAECLSLLPVQRLKAIGRFKPILSFNYIHSQPSIEVGSMKSLFYYVNNVISTYYNANVLQLKSTNNKKDENKVNVSKQNQNNDGNNSDSDNDNDDDDDYALGKVKVAKTSTVNKKQKNKNTPSTSTQFVGFNSNELSNVTLNIPSVVVETPWIQIINSLPPPAYKRQWGKM